VTPKPASTVVLYAHPYPDRSRAGRALIEAVRDLPHVSVRVLYSLYPDFFVDVEEEQAALVAAENIVWQTPFYWYGMPALMHLWIEKVLADGWAYGPDARALAGKRVLWVTTTGAREAAYQPGAMHGYPFETFVPAVEQTARFCGMRWDAPIVVHGAHRISKHELDARAAEYRHRLVSYAEQGSSHE
jgi:glutathione-regulated potassium-efflux system ancillary protein KefF